MQNTDQANPCPICPDRGTGLNSVEKGMEKAAGQMSGLTALTGKADKEDKADIEADNPNLAAKTPENKEKYDSDKEDILLEFFTYARGDYYY